MLTDLGLDLGASSQNLKEWANMLIRWCINLHLFKIWPGMLHFAATDLTLANILFCDEGPHHHHREQGKNCSVAQKSFLKFNA